MVIHIDYPLPVVSPVCLRLTELSGEESFLFVVPQFLQALGLVFFPLFLVLALVF